MQRLVLNLSKRDVLGRIRQLLRNGRSLAHSVVQPKTTSERLQSSVLVEGFVPGKTLHGFNVKKVKEVPELCLTAVRLVHDGTGAEYLHLARDDRNNVFNVCFRTTPMDSTGVPHILEHTVLCGSERYPCRDPFFKMLNRSLATFMNALTGSDYTMYPFATQNPTDFQNLMKVYLDAVFAPHLRVLDFSQEGWRLEHLDVNDATSPIVFKGVVFNEMKGYFANSEQLFAQEQQNRLLPTHTYAHISGGDPIHIPDLTWENLRQFHASHYHPSNARFITYGDFPLEGHLELINERLQLFSRISVDTAVPNQARWTEPRSAHIHFRPDPMLPNPEKNATVSIGYLLGNIADTQEAFTMQILSDLLVSGPNCPFYKSLLEPNIGSNYSPTIGYSGHTKEATFSVGLQGIHPNDIDKVTRIIDETLDEVISSGFPEERIEAILHTIELSMKHVTTNFGLNLSMGVMPLWNHDCSVIQALQINEHIAKFRQNIRANPRLLQEKVEKCLKNNPHRLTLTMTPDAKYEEELKFKEEKKLAEKVKSLTESETRDVYNKGMELLAKQNEAEDISCLPTLLISDIEKVMKYTDIEVSTIGGVPVQICIQPTNGVTYFRGVLKTSGLPPHLRQYIPLFCSILTKLGTDELDYKQLSQRIDLKTGGLSVSSHIADNPLDLTTFEEGIRLYSHCLNKNVQDMFNLWEQIFNSVRFSDKDRLATLIAMMASDLASSIPDSGHSYAVSEASSGLTPAAALRERYGGMKMVTQMKQLAELKKLDEIIVALQEIGSWVLTRNQSRFAVNSTEEALPATLTALDKFLSKTSNSQVVAHTEPTPALLPSKCQYILPFPVHFVGKGIPGVPYCHQDFASLRVLAQLMTSKFLHKEIREKGGAYVGGASYGANGIFSFYSYRDPNNVRTLETFDRAINWAIDGKYTQQDLNEAKLSVFQTVDQPISPGDRGSRLFVSGISDAAVQAHREQLFSIEKHNLIQAAKQYIANSSRVGICILGPQNDAFKTEDGWDLRTDYS